MFSFLWPSSVEVTTLSPTVLNSPQPFHEHHQRSDLQFEPEQAQERTIVVEVPQAVLNEKVPHLHVHNVTHIHTLIYANGTNYTYSANYSHPYIHGGYGAVVPPRYGGGGGFGGGIGTALSGWYQLNLGLIGIGALAVVAIIASRNFFSNYVYYKKSYKYDEPDPYYGSTGGYYRRDWYEDWYDRWYRENGVDYSPDDYQDEHDHKGYDKHRVYSKRDSYYSNRSRYKRNLNLDHGQRKPIVDTGQKEPPDGGRNYTIGTSNNGKRNVTSAAWKTAAHCAFRLTCDLTRQKQRLLTEFEFEVLSQMRIEELGMNIFQATPGQQQTNPGHADYKIAGQLGLDGFNCSKLSGTCPQSRMQVRKTISKFHKQLKLETNKERRRVKTSGDE
ncbi:uncharacterized protein LOC108666162 [Hyalella azteca]|uniref:Uncharacterized protein LOC108666162 n=1 Tax=Hyalella azteca TaxID=294128 RepID=A0A8B7N5C6_HYAAZ|nr:uncharacterized protein LOC108666162 [Hyalella azteca]